MSIEHTDADRAKVLAMVLAKAEEHCKLPVQAGQLPIVERCKRILAHAHHHALEPRLYRGIYMLIEFAERRDAAFRRQESR